MCYFIFSAWAASFHKAWSCGLLLITEEGKVGSICNNENKDYGQWNQYATDKACQDMGFPGGKWLDQFAVKNNEDTDNRYDSMSCQKDDTFRQCKHLHAGPNEEYSCPKKGETGNIRLCCNDVRDSLTFKFKLDLNWKDGYELTSEDGKKLRKDIEDEVGVSFDRYVILRCNYTKV